ncbi:LETM1 protein [Trifolium repens]|nr:LETM1 protein [Trifolium repens]
MAVKSHSTNNFLSLSSSNCRLSNGSSCVGRKVSDLHCLLFSKWGSSRKGWLLRHDLLSSNGHRSVGCRRYYLTFSKTGRSVHLLPFATSDDGMTVNGTPQADTSANLEKMRVKLNSSLEDGNFYDGLVQALYDAARVYELAIKEHKSHSRVSWFSTAWLGVDQTAWVKALSCQAAVYSLLQAASEISSRDDSRDRNVNVFVQRSLLRLSAPLESLIREQLSAKQPEVYEWFWSEQVPAVVTSFVNKFEGDGRFTSSIALYEKSKGLSSASDVSLLLLALTCIAAIAKLGPAKVSCSQFFSMSTEITGSLMDMLVGLIPVSQAYNSITDVGLHREFLVHFGPRAAAGRAKDEWGSEEVVFWVNLVQRQLQQAIDKEKIWSRLTTSESIEVLEKDLAIFGFFIALGRSTQTFLLANGFDTLDDPTEDSIRYLIGGSVLYYPQLSSISSYQMYVEVVCEELDWLPFYPGITSMTKQLHGHSKPEGPPNAEALKQAFDVCSHWMQSFIKYSTWLESPSNVKAAEFLSRGHNKLMGCMEELGMIKDSTLESDIKKIVESERSKIQSTINGSDSFDEALKSVEEAVLKLEKLLQELHVSSSSSGKEHLKAACSDLEKIRKLKKEAEFLEASFRAKADSLQEGVNSAQTIKPVGEEDRLLKGKNRKNDNVKVDRSKRQFGKSRGFWSIFIPPVTRKPDLEPDVDSYENYIEQSTPDVGVVDQESNEIHRFELLRNELMELEKRVQISAYQSENNEDLMSSDDRARYSDDARDVQMVRVQTKESILQKSFDKLKQTGTDVWQGTQLLAIDVGAATGLVRRTLIGDELTEKEKKVLKRTLTDMASVVPIGVLMLIPVTAVGHAAMLAAIQRYVPSLIPSTYAPERLDLLRQLEKVKQMTTNDVDLDEVVDEAK